MIVLVHFLL
jgi:hypothetical protein